MNKKVSICIPTYNQPELTIRAIESVIKQDYKDYEIIISDDSSNNNIENLYNYKYKNFVTYYRNKKTLGPAQNWNRLINFSLGEYIKFLHHDDWFPQNDSLSNFVELLDRNPKSFLAFGATLRCKANGVVIDKYYQEKKIKKLNKDKKVFFPDNIIGAPSAVIFRKKANIFFNENLKWIVDIDFYLEFLKLGKIISTDKVLIATSTGEHTITSSCINNKKIELFEWTYLFNKEFSNYFYRNIFCSKRYYRFFMELFVKHKIYSMDELFKYNRNLNFKTKMLFKIIFNNIEK